MRCSNHGAERCVTMFFRDVDRNSDSSDLPLPSDVPDEIRFPERNYGHNWGLDEMELMESRGEVTKSTVESLRSKLTECDKSPVYSVKGIVKMKIRSLDQ